MNKLFIMTAISAAILAGCDSSVTTDSTTGKTTATTTINPDTTAMKAKIVNTWDDASIVANINKEIIKDPELSAVKINVDSNNGQVTLQGAAPSVEAKARAEMLAKAVTNVQSVNNQLVLDINSSATVVHNDLKEKTEQVGTQLATGTAIVLKDTKDALVGAGNAIREHTDVAFNKTDNSMNRVGDKVEDKIEDAKITTAVNAGLVKDPDLSALKINVDTNNGRVLLKGSAPSTTAKKRATDIAKNVNGVSSVDNELMVK